MHGWSGFGASFARIQHRQSSPKATSAIHITHPLKRRRNKTRELNDLRLPMGAPEASNCTTRTFGGGHTGSKVTLCFRATATGITTPPKSSQKNHLERKKWLGRWHTRLPTHHPNQKPFKFLSKKCFVTFHNKLRMSFPFHHRKHVSLASPFTCTWLGVGTKQQTEILTTKIKRLKTLYAFGWTHFGFSPSSTLTVHHPGSSGPTFCSTDAKRTTVKLVTTRRRSEELTHLKKCSTKEETAFDLVFLRPPTF